MRRLSVLIAALPLVLAGITASATSAVAATATHQSRSVTSVTATRSAGHVSHKSDKTGAVVTPDSCAIVSGHFSEYSIGCVNRVEYSCSVGNDGNLSYIPVFVSNGCGTRVILYQDKGETGNTLCIGPHSTTGTLNNNWRSFRVGSSSSC